MRLRSTHLAGIAFSRLMCRDVRGRKVPVADWVSLREAFDSLGMSPQTFVEEFENAGPPSSLEDAMRDELFVILPVFAFVGMAVSISGILIPGYGTWVTFGGGCILGYLIVRLNQRTLRARGEFVKSFMLRYGLCPSCTYELLSFPQDRNGHIVCPECSAVWKLGTNSNR